VSKRVALWIGCFGIGQHDAGISLRVSYSAIKVGVRLGEGRFDWWGVTIFILRLQWIIFGKDLVGRPTFCND